MTTKIDLAGRPRFASQGASPVPARRRFRLNWSLILLVPYIIAVTVFSLGPALVALVFSFSDFMAGRPEFFAAGLRNYIKVLTDPRFVQAYLNVGEFSLMMTSLGLVGSVGLALLLALTRDRLATVARSLFFLPGAISAAVLGLVFLFMLDPLVSPFGFILRSFGWTSIGNYVSAANAAEVLTVVRFYLMSGVWIAIFYSALESVPDELIEAAKIDGCGAWRLAWNIRRPAIMGFVWFQLILLVGYNIQIFTEPYIIGVALGVGAGHGTVGAVSFINPYWSPNMLGASYVLQRGQFGMSAVVSLVQVLISLATSIIIVAKTGAFSTDIAD